MAWRCFLAWLPCPRRREPAPAAGPPFLLSWPRRRGRTGHCVVPGCAPGGITALFLGISAMVLARPSGAKLGVQRERPAAGECRAPGPG